MEQEKKSGAREARREEWRRIISEQETCGQGAAAYCRERGIPAWKFSYWRKALAPKEADGKRPNFDSLSSL